MAINSNKNKQTKTWLTIHIPHAITRFLCIYLSYILHSRLLKKFSFVTSIWPWPIKAIQNSIKVYCLMVLKHTKFQRNCFIDIQIQLNISLFFSFFIFHTVHSSHVKWNNHEFPQTNMSQRISIKFYLDQMGAQVFTLSHPCDFDRRSRSFKP